MNVGQNIILCGGNIDYCQLPVVTNLSNALIPVNGKPVIGWILGDLLDKGIKHATIVCRDHDVHLRSFVEQIFGSRMDLTLIPLGQSRSILDSLAHGLRPPVEKELIRVILGDTLIQDSFDSDDDFVYVGCVADSSRWCLAITTSANRIVDYLDKPPHAATSRQALAGYYHLQHGALLRECVDESLAAGETELSDVLRRYGRHRPIRALPAKHWFDFGHLDRLVEARQKLLQPRHFNSLSVNPVLNTITKISTHTQKLMDELDWYRNIPDELQVLTPRIIQHRQLDDRHEIVQEYYGYPTLAELYVYAEWSTDTWSSILQRVLAVHQEFLQYPGSVTTADLESMYIHKTFNRLAQLTDSSAYWRRLLAQPEIRFNHQTLQGLNLLENRLREAVTKLTKNSDGSLIHGDFCFSNILFDLNNYITRLIDPRGRFGRKGIYGDPRYDIAKLRHSVSGMYDFIMADMFDLEETDGRFNARVLTLHSVSDFSQSFDVSIERLGYRMDEIRLIEGLLFLSMLPVHRDSPQRQKMMFLQGLRLINQVFSSCES